MRTLLGATATVVLVLALPRTQARQIQHRLLQQDHSTAIFPVSYTASQAQVDEINTHLAQAAGKENGTIALPPHDFSGTAVGAATNNTTTPLGHTTDMYGVLKPTLSCLQRTKYVIPTPQTQLSAVHAANYLLWC